VSITVRIEDAQGNPVQGVTIEYDWSVAGGGNNLSCTTESNGTCVINRNNLNDNGITLTVTDLTGSVSYTPPPSPPSLRVCQPGATAPCP
jgi:hypothetical protein